MNMAPLRMTARQGPGALRTTRDLRRRRTSARWPNAGSSRRTAASWCVSGASCARRMRPELAARTAGERGQRAPGRRRAPFPLAVVAGVAVKLGCGHAIRAEGRRKSYSPARQRCAAGGTRGRNSTSRASVCRAHDRSLPPVRADLRVAPLIQRRHESKKPR